MVILIAMVVAMAIYAFGSSKGSGSAQGDGVRIISNIDMIIRDADGNLKDHIVVHNAVNTGEALDNALERLIFTGAAPMTGGGIFSQIVALTADFNADDPSDGYSNFSITKFIDADTNSPGFQNPGTGSFAAISENGNGSIAVTFTSSSGGAQSTQIRQIALVKQTSDQDTSAPDTGLGVDGRRDIPDDNVLAYREVTIDLSTSDTLTITWTIDLD